MFVVSEVKKKKTSRGKTLIMTICMLARLERWHCKSEQRASDVPRGVRCSSDVTVCMQTHERLIEWPEESMVDCMARLRNCL
jgi:hypothetical protein